MPTLHWIGKDKVVNHHLDVPYRVLNHQYGFTASEGQVSNTTESGNKIIHGDNLEALKALLPGVHFNSSHLKKPTEFSSATLRRRR